MEFSTFFELIIAVAGLVISFLEIKKAKKDAEELKKLKETEKKIIELVRDDEIRKSIKNLEQTLSEVELDLNNLDKLKNKTEQFITEYKKLIDNIKILYKQLLQDEAQFSLSYGFERYINCFRRFVLSRKMDESSTTIATHLATLVTSNEGMQQLVDSGKGNEQTRKIILNHVEYLIGVMNKHQDYSFEQIWEYYVNEQKEIFINHKVKIPDFSSDKTFLAVRSYFKDYYLIRHSIDSLFDEIRELIPYIDELRIKYEEPR